MQVFTRSTSNGILDPTEVDFKGLCERNELLSPDVPGLVLANLVIRAGKSSSGKVYSVVKSPELKEYGGLSS